MSFSRVFAKYTAKKAEFKMICDSINTDDLNVYTPHLGSRDCGGILGYLASTGKGGRTWLLAIFVDVGNKD